MSRTIHHRHQKHRHADEDLGARYKCDKGYCSGTGKYPKWLARRERRAESKKIILEELKNNS